MPVEYTTQRGAGTPRAVRGVGRKVETVLKRRGINSLDEFLDKVHLLITTQGDLAAAFEIYKDIVSGSVKLGLRWIQASWEDLLRLLRERDNYNPNVIAVYDDSFLDKKIEDIPGFGPVTAQKLAQIEGITTLRQLVFIIETNSDNGRLSKMKKERDLFSKRIKNLNPQVQTEKVFSWIWAVIQWKNLTFGPPMNAIENGEVERLNMHLLAIEDAPIQDDEAPEDEEADEDVPVENVPIENQEAQDRLQGCGGGSTKWFSPAWKATSLSVLLSIGAYGGIYFVAKASKMTTPVCHLSSALGVSTIWNWMLLKKGKREAFEKKEMISTDAQTNPLEIRKLFEQALECVFCGKSDVNVQLTCVHVFHRDCHNRDLRRNWNTDVHDGQRAYRCPFTCTNSEVGITASPYKTAYTN